MDGYKDSRAAGMLDVIGEPETELHNQSPSHIVGFMLLHCLIMGFN